MSEDQMLCKVAALEASNEELQKEVQNLKKLLLVLDENLRNSSKLLKEAENLILELLDK